MEPCCFTSVQLSPTVYRIVENDNFHENPFIYLIQGDDKLVLIDTGCGTGDLLNYVQNEFSKSSLVSPLLDKILVINTHNHYDHVGCNHVFSSNTGKLNPNCLDLCASSRDKKYTEDRFSTLGCFVGSKVKSYKITRWLEDQEEIPLSKEDTGNFLKVFHTPGHTPDSICLYYPKDNRIFVGDVIYRWAAILAIGVGADPYEYQASVENLYRFVQKTTKNPKQHPLKLSCGHVDDNLECDYIEKLADLLKNINSDAEALAVLRADTVLDF